MSNQTLRRGINRLKSDVKFIKPRPLVQCKLIGEPSDDATNEVKAAYQAELDAALAAGLFVIRLVGIKSDPIKTRWQKPADLQAQPSRQGESTWPPNPSNDSSSASKPHLTC